MRTTVRFGPPSVERSLGALPVVAAFEKRLDIAGTIDRMCPVRDVAVATHGQVIEALVANRLTAPAPLVHVEDWAGAFAVPEVFGIDAGTLTTTGWVVRSTRSPPTWTRSSDRSGRGPSSSSASTCPACTGT